MTNNAYSIRIGSGIVNGTIYSENWVETYDENDAIEYAVRQCLDEAYMKGTDRLVTVFDPDGFIIWEINA